MICSIEDCQYRSVNSEGLCLAHFRAKAKPAASVSSNDEPVVVTEDEPEETTGKWWHKDTPDGE